MMIASVFLGLGIVQLSFQLGNTVYRSLTWTAETKVTERRVQSLQQDVKILEDAQRWATHPAYLEQLARCQGYVRKSERVVVAEAAKGTPAPGYNCQAVRLP